MKRAGGLYRAGRLAEAIDAYRQVIHRAPQFAEAHNNLAAALNASGAKRAATRSWRRAIALRPGYAMARAGLGTVLVELGEVTEGLEELAAAHLAAPGDVGFRERLLATLAPLTPARAGPKLTRALDLMAEDPAVDLQRLARPGAALLRRNPVIAAAMVDPDDLPAADLGAAFATPRFRALLSDALLPDAAIESLLTSLRRRWLHDRPDDGDLLATVALQAQMGEWAWAETPEERAQVDAAPPAATGLDDGRLLLRALYRPLQDLPQAETLASRVSELPPRPRRTLFHRALVEPREEAALAAALPALTGIENATSRRVRAQYEANAYPRWRRMTRRPARAFAEVLAGILPAAPSTLPAAPRVLVAGCGTGRHALATATRYAGAQVLAIDLSRAALGYAARQARDLGVGNIAFAQADILGLAGLERRFDLVECSGTLHHMADPEAGWRVLRGLVAPGGLMRIALYSERGRAGVVEGRAEIARLGLAPTPEGIRAARTALRALPADSPVHPFTQSADFFSLSGCRDLFFHVHETRFDLPRIARALEALDLEFLGFELPSDSIRRAFRSRFADPGAERDLAAWDAFEAEHPTAFAAMYQFWCRAR